jgi:hypothetical protein
MFVAWASHEDACGGLSNAGRFGAPGRLAVGIHVQPTGTSGVTGYPDAVQADVLHTAVHDTSVSRLCSATGCDCGASCRSLLGVDLRPRRL